MQWTLIKDKPSRNAQPFNQQMVNQVFDFYFRNYTGHFSKPGFREALCSIPQVGRGAGQGSGYPDADTRLKDGWWAPNGWPYAA